MNKILRAKLSLVIVLVFGCLAYDYGGVYTPQGRAMLFIMLLLVFILDP